MPGALRSGRRSLRILGAPGDGPGASAAGGGAGGHAPRFRPDDAEADASAYELWFQRTEQMGGKSGGAEVRTDFPQMKTWVGRRVEGRPARGQ